MASVSERTAFARQGDRLVAMLCVTLTLAKHVDDDQAQQIIDQLLASLVGHAGETARFAAVGQRQVQGGFYSAEEGVGFILSAARSGLWAIQVTLISRTQVEQYEQSNDVDIWTILSNVGADGTVVLRTPGGVTVSVYEAGSLRTARTVSELGLIESGLQLLCSIERRRSDEGQEAGLVINSGSSQIRTAQVLGVSQQAVSARLQAGYWYESRRVAYWLAVQIQDFIEP